jgi:hypothetical protein
MQNVSLAVTLVTILLGVTLSIRLLRLAARTRKAPELAMGLYCTLVTTGSLLYAAAFRGGLGVESEGARWLSAAFTLCIGLGVFALAVGIWRIFLPGERWMPLAVTAVGLWIGAGWLACVLPGHPVTLGDVTPANVLFLTGRLAVYAFGAFQAFRYARMLERRAALGLADALAAHQIRLWGMAWILAAMVGSSTFVIMEVGGREAFAGVLVPSFISAVNASAWICTWLAFFPPVAYQRWAAGASARAAA